MKSTPRRVLATLLAALALAAPTAPSGAQVSVTDLPALGDPGSEELTPIAERRLGEAIMRDLRRRQSVLADPDLTDYLNGFAASLTSTPTARGYAFEFFLVPDRSLNAFALPGGFIAVHTGLIVAAQSESELASVLAHEIGHVTQRHIARMLGQQRRSSLVALAAAVIAALAARSSPDAAMGMLALGDTLAAQQMMSFSRDAEREADRIGIEILSAAQFDTDGMLSFFGRLQQASRLYESDAPAYLRTHPLTGERMADMQSRIREVPYRQRPDSLEFLLVRARLRALQDPSVDGLRAARVFFERMRRERVLPAAVAWYGEAVAAVSLRDFAGARRLLDAAREALAAGRANATGAAIAGGMLAGGDTVSAGVRAGNPGRDTHAFIERLDAERALLAGEPAEALAIAAAARERFGDSRGLAQMHARALLAAQRHTEAAELLTDLTRRFGYDIELWRLLAEAQHAAGRPARAHRAAAESFALVGAWQAAIEQLRLAQRVGGVDFVTASMIDSRLRELQQEFQRERELQDRGAN